ncbi:hypothetical protein [Thermoanaerobacterium thermosaccharolyticum]|uniref:hypothetical protein n=1 Tax=Thermoanaerobacterium thermosaccharolyticum TaxID=1517 RepID=UPI003DA99E57
MLREEFKRALFDKKLLFVVLVSLLLLFLSAYQSILKPAAFANINSSDISDKKLYYENVIRPGQNVYLIWSQSYYLIKTFFVFMIILPFTYSYIYERNKKFNYFSISRIGLKKYHQIKFIVNGITGGIALVLPELIYYIILLLVARNEILPVSILRSRGAPDGLYSSIFFKDPNKYIFIVFIMHFILGFSFAGFSAGITSFFNKKYIIYTLPYIFFIIYEIAIFNINQNYSMTNAYNFFYNKSYDILHFIILNLGLLAIGIITYYINYKVVLKNG